MEQVVVIANPVASQFTGGAHRDVMAELAKTTNVQALWPSSAAEATTSARDAAEGGADVVVAMGGDGMVHHVAQGLIDSGTALGIVPAGTTNVVARIFGIPFRPARAARLIARAREPVVTGTAKMTLARGDTETTHFSLFACGLGLDAEVVKVADAEPYRKYRFGSLHYARSALRVGLREYPKVKPHVRFTAGDLEAIGTTALIQFRDVYTYFGSVGLRFDDQMPEPMSALVLTRLRRRRVPRVITRAIFHSDLGQIEGFDVWHDLDRFEFEASPEVAAQSDGESLGLTSGGVIEWAPANLRLVAPLPRAAPSD